MFTSQEYIDRKTGEHGIGRLSYLQSIVTEFQDTSEEDAKEQVLANLANFAYDPINYAHFKKLNVIDLFLDCLEDSNENLIEFAVGGLCNCCLDKDFKQDIINSGGIPLIIKCLSRPVQNTVLSAITTLMYLVTPASKQEITTLPVVECMLRFSKSSNKQLANLATLFLEDYCTKDQIEKAKDVQRKMAAQFTSQES
ncbi:armadillo repeat-containing protein 7 [Aplysia californica]|uniref:Armadillo repeat-containing protein 7 n=1 Tax=Aplysia californica TaxID=6500 RepID=A0ABM0K527_APLCA|nr:armadillo repeat-containing protein 7 [Aplysia californica]